MLTKPWYGFVCIVDSDICHHFSKSSLQVQYILSILVSLKHCRAVPLCRILPDARHACHRIIREQHLYIVSIGVNSSSDYYSTTYNLISAFT